MSGNDLDHGSENLKVVPKPLIGVYLRNDGMTGEDTSDTPAKDIDMRVIPIGRTARKRMKSLASGLAEMEAFGCPEEKSGHILDKIDYLEYKDVRRFRYLEKKEQRLVAEGRMDEVRGVQARKIGLLGDILGGKGLLDGDFILTQMENDTSFDPSKYAELAGEGVTYFGDRTEMLHGALKVKKGVASALATILGFFAFGGQAISSDKAYCGVKPVNHANYVAFHGMDDVVKSINSGCQTNSMVLVNGSGQDWQSFIGSVEDFYGLNRTPETDRKLERFMQTVGKNRIDGDYSIAEIKENGVFDRGESVFLPPLSYAKPNKAKTPEKAERKMKNEFKEKRHEKTKTYSYKPPERELSNWERRLVDYRPSNSILNRLIFSNFLFLPTIPASIDVVNKLNGNGTELSGKPGEFLPFDHHGTLGMGLYVLGKYIHDKYPETFNNLPPDLKFALGPGGMFLTYDDIIQHERQANDGYHARPGQSENDMYTSPVNRLYRSLNDPKNNNDPLKVGIISLGIPGFGKGGPKFTAGYFRGPFLGLEQEIAKTGPLHLAAEGMTTIQWERPAKQIIEQVNAGGELQLDIWKKQGVQLVAGYAQNIYKAPYVTENINPGKVYFGINVFNEFKK